MVAFSSVTRSAPAQLYSRARRAPRAARAERRGASDRGRPASRAQRRARRGRRVVAAGPSRPSADERRDAIDRRRDHRQARGHVLEDLQRRPVEAERQRRDARRSRTARRRCRRPPGTAGIAACGTAPVKTTLVEAGGVARDGRQFGAVADEHRADVGPARGVQLAQRRTRWIGAVPAPERAGEHRDGRRRPLERRRARCAGTEAIGVGAPLELARSFAPACPGGRIAALGVTIRSARAQMRSRHRRIGSTMSARSSRALGEPG